jgi:hypothetical protein
MPNNSGGHFLPHLQYITLENGFFEGKLDKKTDRNIFVDAHA